MTEDSLATRAEVLSEGHLQTLIEGLNRGEEQAIQRAYQAYQPFLRMLVRRRLSSPFRTRIDSLDVVQSLWAELLTGFRRAGWKFPNATYLRAFLARVARNRLRDRQRKHGPALVREQAIADGNSQHFPAPGNERPSQVVQADDLWDRIVASCPPSYREILLLKREGRTSAEIAARVGLHEASVRRILCDLARRLGLEAKGGSRVANRPRG